jgi:hypothetical protein
MTAAGGVETGAEGYAVAPEVDTDLASFRGASWERLPKPYRVVS